MADEDTDNEDRRRRRTPSPHVGGAKADTAGETPQERPQGETAATAAAATQQVAGNAEAGGRPPQEVEAPLGNNGDPSGGAGGDANHEGRRGRAPRGGRNRRGAAKVVLCNHCNRTIADTEAGKRDHLVSKYCRASRLWNRGWHWYEALQQAEANIAQERWAQQTRPAEPTGPPPNPPRSPQRHRPSPRSPRSPQRRGQSPRPRGTVGPGGWYSPSRPRTRRASPQRPAQSRTPPERGGSTKSGHAAGVER